MTKEQKANYDNYRKTALQVAESMVQDSAQRFSSESDRNKMVLSIFEAFMDKQGQQISATSGKVTFEFQLILSEVEWSPR